MTEGVHWQEINEKYLAAALKWLRARLSRMITDAPREQEEVRIAKEAMRSAASIEPGPALPILAQQFGLSQFEENVLLLCAALELDTRIAELCAASQPDAARTFPTFALALACFDEPAWEALSPHRPLRYWQLIEINQPGPQPLTTSALRADERVVNYIKGLNHLDDRLTPYLFALETEASPSALPESLAQVARRGLSQIASGLDKSPLEIIQLVGPDGGSKRAVAREMASHLGLALYRLPVDLLPAQIAELETLARLWQRETILTPVALYLDALEGRESPSTEAGAGVSPLRRLLARLDGLLFLDTRHTRAQLGRSSIVLDVERPTTAEQRASWNRFAPQAVPAQLAAQFNLNQTGIERIGGVVGQGDRPELQDYWDACRLRTRPNLDMLAQRLTPKASWDEIVLPQEQMRLLREITDQVRRRTQVYEDWGFRDRMNRGLGISALFSGESGTGKTMAAEVIANELRLDLYRIDLSAVVSKYIGETEKNLRQLFDAAEAGGAILFFDEADALFGKRSEVRDSHDRYANIEISYLLQRMEAYRGLAILATNLKNTLDMAFLRRLRFVVHFPFPGPEERAAIWEGIYPATTPVAELDTSRLARLQLTGGNIHNIALNAAFLAARDGGQVTMPLILQAARSEYRKLERSVDEREFVWPEE